MVLPNGKRATIEYALQDATAVIKEFGSSPHGLTEGEVRRRLEEFGPNVFVEKKELGLFVQFLMHFANPLILVLIFAATISAFMGASTDAIIIFSIILFGVALDFYQEYSADRALKKLTETVKATAIVLRDGKEREIRIKDIVPGDVISSLTSPS
jgi:magnesium-transporting ATPase (P-type)